MEEIQHTEHNNSGSFYVYVAGKKAAELDYRKLKDKEIIIDHTHVSDVLKGKGIGKLLVEAAVSWARENKFKVVPQCGFARAVIEKDEKLQDVLY